MGGSTHHYFATGRDLRALRTPDEHGPVTAVLPLSPAQLNIWMSSALIGDGPEHNPAQYLVIRGRLDEELFRRSTLVVARECDVHGARFGEGPDGVPTQQLGGTLHDGVSTVDLTCENDPTTAARQWMRSRGTRPVDRNRGPLHSWTLLRLSAEEHWWHMRGHHIVTDLYSFRLITERVAEVYSALDARRAYPPRRFGAWIETLRSELAYATSVDRAVDGEYWSYSVADADRWGGDRRPPGTRRDALRRSFPVDAGLRLAVRDRCRVLGVRPAHFLVAAFGAYLRELSGDDRAVFSLPVTARRDELARSTPGMLSNVLPVGLALPPHVTIEELLRRTRGRLTEIVGHSRYRGEDLARDLGAGHGGAWFGPVLNVVEFNRSLRFADAVADPPRNLSVGPTQNLTLTTYGWSHGDRAWLDFDLDGTGAAAEIDLHHGRFLEMLDHLATGPGGRRVRLSASFATDRTLIRRWQETAPAPDPEPVPERIRRWAARCPDTVAVRCGDERVTFAELEDRADRLARVLAGHGVGAESGVAVLLPRSADLAVAFSAVLRSGGVYVPMPLGHPPERLRFMAADAAATVLLTVGERDLSWFAGTVLRMNRLPEPPGAPAAPRATDPDQLAYVAYTSGSTGTPKGVGITRRALAGYAAGWDATLSDLATGDDARGGRGGPVLSMAGTGFDVSIGDLTRGLCLGHGLVLLPDTTSGISVESLHRTIRDHDVAVAEIVPGVLLRELAAWIDHAGPLAGLRVLISGTDTWRRSALADTVRAIAPAATPGNVYGVTEATIDSLFMPLTGDGTDNDTDRDDDAMAPVGRPLPGVRALVLDAHLRPAPAGVPGELFIGGDGLARGYLNRPDLTAERFLPDPHHPGRRLYRTGDRARWTPRGQVEFLGRVDDQLKIRGYRIEPGEIQAVLIDHPAVRDAVVTARDDGPGGTRLIAHLVPDARDIDTGAVREFATTRLPGYMVPAAFVVLDHGLPLTPNGKVDHRALPDPAPGTAGDYVAARTGTEHVLTRIWQQTLGLERVGTHDNFFELGGDSILSLQIVARARTAGLHIDIADVFAHQTVAALAPVTVPVDPTTSTAEQGTVVGPVALTPIEHWFLDQDIADRDHWNWSGVVATTTDVDPERLARAFDTLVAHHDALRLRLVHDGGRWHQHNAGTEHRALLTVEDVAGLHPAALADHVTRHMTGVQTTLSLADGPLLRAVLFDRGDEPAWIGITAHHLAVDGVSWRILLQDLGTVYDGGAPPPKTTSFRTWARKLCSQADTATTWAEIGYWRHQLERGRPLPVDRDGPNTEDSTRVVRARLDPETTAALQTRVHRAYRTQVNDIVLAALLRTVGRWAGTTTLGIDFESHGREPLDGTDVTRTIGWFTSIYPVTLHTPDLDDPAQLITSVKEHLRGVPRRGLGYGLLRHVTAVPGDPGDRDRLRVLRELPSPQILFNYMGATDADRAVGPITRRLPDSLAGPRRGPETGRKRSHLIQIEAAQDADGRLVVEWFHSAEVHRSGTVRRLADQHLSALRELVGHCLAPGAGHYTPSDFPLSTLDGQGLTAVLKRIGGG